MKQAFFTILENTPLTPDVNLLRLGGDASAITVPGQFAALQVPGYFLRRPFSVHDFSAEEFSVVYKQAGNGTETLGTLQKGNRIEALTGLGNGYSTADAGESPLLVGGGTGASPMLCLAKRLVAEGRKPQVILGFASAADVFGVQEIEALGLSVTVTTVDGSMGVRGFVTDALPETYTYIYTCGPEPMMKALAGAARTGMQLSLEARMGCGFGACMGCTCKTLTGGKRVCKEGPVFTKEEMLWEN